MTSARFTGGRRPPRRSILGASISISRPRLAGSPVGMRQWSQRAVMRMSAALLVCLLVLSFMA